MNNTTTQTNLQDPRAILNQCVLLNHTDHIHESHELIVRFGSPETALYFDETDVLIDGVEYSYPLILPIYNAQMELIQCAVMQDQKIVKTIPERLPKGFAYFGELQHDKPIILVYDLEAFFKLAQSKYAVCLVVLDSLCTQSKPSLRKSDFERVSFIATQLSKAGFKKVYLPCQAEQVKDAQFQQLSKDTGLYLLNESIKVGNDVTFLDIHKEDDIIGVEVLMDEAIKQSIQFSFLPKGHLAKPFKMDDSAYLHILDIGLYLIKEKQDEDGTTKQTKTFIAHSVVILGEARSLNNDNWKRVIQFKDKDQQQHTLLIPYEHFMGEAQDALKIIANHGLMPPRQANKKNIFINYIQDYPIERRFRCVDRTGWHSDAFVTPSQTYGNHQSEELLFHYDGKNPYSTQGSLAGWQELSKLIEPHSLGVLVFSCAFAGQLIKPLGVESGGFHIYGSSTDGKSTITKAACSVWGNPKDISKSWRTTDNALENEAELRNDSFLNLDELRQAMPKVVSDIVYMLTGEQGKARSGKTGKNRDMKHFSLMYTSTGEVTLGEHLRRGNIELDAGLLLRFAHLPSDAGKGYGVFEQINHGKKPQDIGNRINALSAQNYGFAGAKWLEYLTNDKEAVIAQAQTLFEHFIQSYSTTRMNGQASRVLRRFALVAVAGELATQANITTWQTGRAMSALKQCFDTWLSHFGTGGNLEEIKVLEHIKAFFEANGTSRFEDLTVLRHADGEVMRQRINNRVGYYDPDEKTYLVSPTMFKKEMCIGFNEANAKKVLIKYGWITEFIEGGKKLYAKRSSNNLPDGTRPRMMHFNALAIQNTEYES